jgi:hypothetical protein
MPPDMASVAFMALVDLGKGNELILWDGESIGHLNERRLIRIKVGKMNLQFNMFSKIQERETGILHIQKFCFC